MQRTAISVGFALLTACWLHAPASADDFPAIYNSEIDADAAPPTPEESLAQLELPAGYSATVFAAEPDVQNPIAMAWDSRGRLWVAENYTYAERPKRFDAQLRDRILIFEDADGDGRHDARRVFMDDVQQLTSVEVGHGGVWALCPPKLLFIPDEDSDDVPDGPAQVVLDGFTVPAVNYHNFANGLRWGPDGWLYGRCGASAAGEIGKPGTPADARLPLRGGMWRYQPRTQRVEVICSGPVNPWGHDWNEHGELFCVNTVGGHLWHVFPGAHYRVLHTIDPNPRAYDLLDTHADHWHFDVARGWPNSRDGAANEYGGGHAHAGAMVYLGDNWPEDRRRRLFTLNYFGRRANDDVLEQSGAGYVGKHGGDSFIFHDSWFRGLDLSYGPDGGVVVLDWCDTGECHESTGVHRASGRIYKIVYSKASSSDAKNLADASARELVEFQRHPNEWYARQARLQLADRARRGHELTAAVRLLHDQFASQTNPVIQLRALWALYAVGAADETFLRAQLRHADEHIRVWAIRLLSDFWPVDTVMSFRPAGSQPELPKRDVDELCSLAQSDSSGLVCLTLASTLQRMPVMQRPPLAAALMARGEYARDPNLPLMVWYGLIPVGDAAPDLLASLAADCGLPLTRKYIARRLGEDLEQRPAPLDKLLLTVAQASAGVQRDVIAGLWEACRGLQSAPRPAAWGEIQQALASAPSSEVRDRVRDLSVLFGDGRALDEVRNLALDQQATLALRRQALETLIASRPPDLRAICEQLLSERFLNTCAMRGLTLFDDPAVGDKLVEEYERFHPTERPAVIDALSSRPAFAGPLLTAIEKGTVPRTDLTPFHARQILSLGDSRLSAQLGDAWGVVRDSPAEKQRSIAAWKAKLTPAELAAADLSAGRATFNSACASCHSLYGQGDAAGLDLTGSGRDNLDFLLNNMVDPSAEVNADFRLRIINLQDGRTLNGIVLADGKQSLKLKTVREVIVVDRREIEDIQIADLSLMPEGLLESFTESQVRDLVAYLMHPHQVELPGTQ